MRRPMRDISRDQYLLDGLQTAILKIDGSDDVTLEDCVGDEPITIREMEPVAGQVPQRDRLFFWPAALSVEPPLGAVLVAGSVYWTILVVRYKDLVETWEAKCRNLSIVTAAANVATILKATYDHAQGGEARPTWHGAFSGQYPPTTADTIPAHFQPSAETAQILFGADYTEEVYRVVFDAPVPIELAGGEYRLTDQQGYRYRVQKYYDENRIDKLPVAIATRILEGQDYFSVSGT